MQTSFFTHPLWRKFQGRQTFVIGVSDPEHRLRDAKAIMRLRDFLPPSDSGMCTYAISTVYGSRPAIWPTIPSDAGVVILGRPALFGPRAHNFIQQCSPPCGYHFEADVPGELAKYRTILTADVEARRFSCPSFKSQLRVKPTPSHLYDYGLIYSGWQGKTARPVMLLAGTSTLGTWGAVEFATGNVQPEDVRWYEDVQGIVRAEALNSPEAFEGVDAKPLESEMLSPCRIWMDGRDLPPNSKDAWKNAYARRLRGPLDLRIYVNGKEIMPKLRSFIPPLVLLALANSKSQERFPILVSEGTASRISEAVRTFLGVESEDWAADGTKQRIWTTLELLIKQIRGAGGIAFVRKPRTGDDADTKVFNLTTRPLPFFLPRVP